MARMFPPKIRSDCQSNAEKRFFDVLQKGLGDEWSVLHSVGLTLHHHKPWTEVDFVIVGPPGIFCLEVKGGRVARQDGMWHFTNAAGITNSKAQGPFEQVGPASAALRAFLLGEVPSVYNAAFGYGVLTPDIEWKITGPDVIPETIYDVRDKQKPLGSYIRRLTNYWHDRLELRKGHPISSLSEQEREKIVEVLRGDFHFVPSLKTLIGQAEEELLQLTKEQYRVLDGLRENPRTIVKGGAGTGKTLLAVEEARRRAQEGEKVLLCCYNEQLGAWLGEAVKDIENITAAPLPAYMASLIGEAGLRDRLPRAEREDLESIFYPEVAQEALLQLDRLASFDTLIIDEAQDLLLLTYIDFFDCLLKDGLQSGRWMVFYDPFQDIFNANAPDGRKRLMDGHPIKWTLGLNCRNTRHIAVGVQILSGIHTGETLHAGGPEIVHEWYRDAAHQKREVAKCVNKLLGDGVPPEDIILLSPRHQAQSVVAGGLPNVAFPIVPYAGPTTPARKIRFACIDDYKGLESPVVIVTDITDLESDAAAALVYVGASRAKSLLCVFVDEKQKSAYAQNALEYGAALLQSSSVPNESH